MAFDGIDTDSYEFPHFTKMRTGMRFFHQGSVQA